MSREVRKVPADWQHPTPSMKGRTMAKPIERDESYDRTYIPLPGGWEVQTKGKGSTFRICEPGDDPHRLAIPDSPYLHETLTRMAREIHADYAALQSELARLREDRDSHQRVAIEAEARCREMEAERLRLLAIMREYAEAESDYNRAEEFYGDESNHKEMRRTRRRMIVAAKAYRTAMSGGLERGEAG